jgi:hypothetical protein
VFTKTFWKQTLERLIKTFAQAILALITSDGLGIVDVNWGRVLSVGALAALASLLTSIVSSRVGQPNNPSAVKTGASA